ncbi:hypothetical protein SAMN04490183_1276 [Pseudomonas corrugata]|nr:hypothetical protein SAMN04490183_1276 [Pseudomonas corrugata]
MHSFLQVPDTECHVGRTYEGLSLMTSLGPFIANYPLKNLAGLLRP